MTEKQESPRAEGPYYVHEWPEGAAPPHNHEGRYWVRETNGDDEDGPFRDRQRAQDKADIRNARFRKFFAQGQSSDRYRKMWEALKAWAPTDFFRQQGNNTAWLSLVEKMTELEKEPK